MRYLSLSGVFVYLGVAFFSDEFGVNAAPAAAAEEAPKPASTRDSKKANIFSHLSQKQIANFEEALRRTDVDNDGIISKEDLRKSFEAIDRLTNDKELDEISGDVIPGSADEEDPIINAVKSFDDAGKIDSEKLFHALTTWEEKFTADEIDDAQTMMIIDNKGGIDIGKLIAMLTASQEDEEKEPGAA